MKKKFLPVLFVLLMLCAAFSLMQISAADGKTYTVKIYTKDVVRATYTVEAGGTLTLPSVSYTDQKNYGNGKKYDPATGGYVSTPLQFFGWFNEQGEIYAPGATVTVNEDTIYYEAIGIEVASYDELNQGDNKADYRVARLTADIRTDKTIGSNQNRMVIDLNGHTYTGTHRSCMFDLTRSGVYVIGKGTLVYASNDASYVKNDTCGLIQTTRHGWYDGAQDFLIGRGVSVDCTGSLVRVANDMSATSGIPKIRVSGKVTATAYMVDMQGVQNADIRIYDGAELFCDKGLIRDTKPYSTSGKVTIYGGIIHAEPLEVSGSLAFSIRGGLFDADDVIPMTGDGFTVEWDYESAMYRVVEVPCTAAKHTLVLDHMTDGKEPGCTTSGRTTWRCTTCGYITERDAPPLGHTPGARITETAMTQSTRGYSYAVCSRCLARVNEQYTLPNPKASPVKAKFLSSDGKNEVSVTLTGEQVFSFDTNNAIAGMKSNVTVNGTTYNFAKQLLEIEVPFGTTNLKEGGDDNNHTSVFYPCLKLRKVTLPTYMPNLSKYALAYLSSLETVENVSGIEGDIGDHAFKQDKGSALLSFDELRISAVNVGAYAFENVKAKSLVFTNTKVNLGEGFFYHDNASPSGCNEVIIPGAPEDGMSFDAFYTAYGSLFFASVNRGTQYNGSNGNIKDLKVYSAHALTVDERLSLLPTCEKDGFSNTYCDRCGGQNARIVLPAKGHDEKINYASYVDSTCSVPGSYGYTCRRCGKESVASVPTKEHDYAYQTTVIASDHPGFDVFACKECAHVELRNLQDGRVAGTTPDYVVGDANADGKVTAADLFLIKSYLAGKNVTLAERASDVDGNGKIDAEDASLLEKYLNGAAVVFRKAECTQINPTCQTHERTSSVAVCEQSCKTDKVSVRYCVKCGAYVATDVVKSEGHRYAYVRTVSPVTTAGREADGYDLYECPTCHRTVQKNIVPALPHVHAPSNRWVLHDATRDHPLGFETCGCANSLTCGQEYERDLDYSAWEAALTDVPEFIGVYCTPDSAAALGEAKTALNEAVRTVGTIKLAGPGEGQHLANAVYSQSEIDKIAADFEAALGELIFYRASIPMIYLETLDDVAISKTYSPARITVLDTEDSDTEILIDAGGQMRIRGNSTAGLDKKPYNFKFSKKRALFGMDKAKKWTLLANRVDPTLLRNKLVLEFASSDWLNQPYTPDSRYVEVWLDGKYIGNYLLCESVDTGKGRVDLDHTYDEDEPKNNALYDNEGNFITYNFDFLLEFERNRTESETTYLTSDIYRLRFIAKSPEYPSSAEISYMKAELRKAEEALQRMQKLPADATGAERATAWAEVEAHFDIPSMIDFYIAVEYFKNCDFNYSSTNYYYENGKVGGGPVWDFDLALGNVQYQNNDNYGVYNNLPGISNTGTHQMHTKTNGSGHSYEGIWCDYQWYEIFLTLPEFTSRLRARYEEIQPLILSLYRDLPNEPSVLTTLYEDNLESFKRNYANKNNTFAMRGAGWSFSTQMAGRILPPGASLSSETEWLREWLAARNEWLLDYFQANY